MEKLSFGASKSNLGSAKKKSGGFFSLPWWGWVIVGLLAVVIFALAIILTVVLSLKDSVDKFRRQATDTYVRAQMAYDAFKAQDLEGTRTLLADTKTSYEYTKRRYEDLRPLMNFTGYGKYYEDGLVLLQAGDESIDLADHIIEIVEPAAEMLGFTKEEGEDGDDTTEDRVKRLLDTLQIIGPQLDEVITGLDSIAARLDEIDLQKYPETVGELPWAGLVLNNTGHSELADMPLRSQLVDGKKQLAGAIATAKEYRPILDKIPEMAGGTGERMKYLVIFQNNNELRPTGGFLTAYAIIFVEDGKVVPEKSDDIYELDKKFAKKIKIPEKLGKYLTTEKYWHLRDMNIDPDFKRSMDTFMEYYATIDSEPQDINGIITIDTFVLTQLIDILGPIQVEGYGEFSTEPDAKYNAPQIIVALSEIITRPTPYIREDRKGILGPMMKAMLEKVYGASKDKFPDLFSTLIALMDGRHIQTYFIDDELQNSAEMINLAGRMTPPTDGSDFMAIVDANLGGAKSNLFIDYEVEQTVLPPENGELTKRVVITYTNSQAGDNCNLEAGLLCLNSVNNDWFRLYLPEGSKLVSAKGFKGEAETYDENGFTVIDGYFSLNPKSTTKLDLEYTVPYEDSENYRLQIWQQGGLREVPHLIDVNDNQEEIIVTGDVNYTAKF